MVKRLKPDVVLVHGLISPWQVIGLRFTLGPSARIMIQHHAERPFRDFRKYIQQWADRYVQAYLFASKDLGAMWVNEGQIKHPSKIKEVMEGSSSFHPIDPNRAKEFTHVKDGKVFLWVGDLTINKDPLLAARAFIEFMKQDRTVNLYMVYQERHLEEDLKKLVQGYENIHLVGRVKHEELLYWYNAAHYIISTSHYEGSGIAVCEAMACGCIPILSNIPSFRMMTSNGECGLLFNCDDENDLVKKLQQSLQLPLETQRELVLKKFRNDLSFEAIARKTVEVANEIFNDGAQ
jgi:glycosyltransferase involved in cell wall biosynthesis